MIRHWTSWDEGKRSHLFVADAQTGAAKDLTPKLEVNTPPAPFGGSSDYAFSPDGKEIAFTAEPIENAAWLTNTDIWTVPVAGGEPKNITAENQGADAQPAYSPDGQWLAYVSQARAGFESDQWVLKARLRSSQSSIELTKSLDRPVQSFAWAPSSNKILAVIDDAGTEPILAVDVNTDSSGSAAKAAGSSRYPRLITGGAQTGLHAGTKDGKLVFVRHFADRPAEIYAASSDGSGLMPLTHHNAPLLAQLDLPKLEGFTFSGADGEETHGWLLRPPGFEANKTYPVVFLIHGGPQGAWHDEWHNRWNYQMFAAPGYAVVAINPRGSTGYGQKFTDQISQDWTGRVYDDLMKGLDFALKTYPFLDGTRIAAAGGSYGGFMVNWLAGHTDRFKALISHAGVFDLTSKYGTTEELWFPEWEFGGPPWEKPEHYRERSPSAYAANFKTPTLGDSWSTRFPSSRRPGPGHVHIASAAGSSQPLRLVPRRGALDHSAPESHRLVAGGDGVAGQVSQALNHQRRDRWKKSQERALFAGRKATIGSATLAHRRRSDWPCARTAPPGARPTSPRRSTATSGRDPRRTAGRPHMPLRPRQDENRRGRDRAARLSHWLTWI